MVSSKSKKQRKENIFDTILCNYYYPETCTETNSFGQVIKWQSCEEFEKISNNTIKLACCLFERKKNFRIDLLVFSQFVIVCWKLNPNNLVSNENILGLIIGGQASNLVSNENILGLVIGCQASLAYIRQRKKSHLSLSVQIFILL